jgi:hypothetical protein
VCFQCGFGLVGSVGYYMHACVIPLNLTSRQFHVDTLLFGLVLLYRWGDAHCPFLTSYRIHMPVSGGLAGASKDGNCNMLVFKGSDFLKYLEFQDRFVAGLSHFATLYLCCVVAQQGLGWYGSMGFIFLVVVHTKSCSLQNATTEIGGAGCRALVCILLLLTRCR